MSASEHSVTVLVPAFNEEGAIAQTIEALTAQSGAFRAFEIIVINDGSNDRTGEIARSLGVRVTEHQHNRGYGAALKSGLHQASHDLIVIADADGTYPLDDI